MPATQLRLTLALAFRRVTLLAFAQGAEHAAAEARAVADGNARAGPVFISGATGPCAASINGFFVVTEEKSLDGRLVLSKRGDPSVCIEHYGGAWEVKPASFKGKDGCVAYVAGGCALEDCASREGWEWKRVGRSTEREDGDWKGSGAAGERRILIAILLYVTSILFCRPLRMQWFGHL
jgi:hypothetical protein